MAEFYTWPEQAHLLLTLLLVLSVLFQCLTLVFSFHRYPRGQGWFFENLLELWVLFQILICSLLHGQFLNMYGNGLIAPTGYGFLRIVCFAAIVLTAATLLVMTEKPGPILIVVAASLTLPVMEAMFNHSFAYLYLAAMLFWLARGIRLSHLRYKEIRTGLSALSVRETIDSLHTAVLFGEPDGFILLSNVQMQRMMKTVSGKVQRNGNCFYEQLAVGALKEDCHRELFEGQIVCLLPDETAWMFTRTVLRIKKKEYIQLTATDISQYWLLTVELRQRQKQLKKKGDELSEAMETLHILGHEREVQKAKMRAHDVLGQRLSMLLRTMRSAQTLDYDLLRSLSRGLLDDLKLDQGRPLPQEELDGLRQAFGSIGVNIVLMGKLPENREKERLFVDIIREGVTNAVRHGFATVILIRVDFSESHHHLKITDNGYPPAQPILEGGGLQGMRRKLEPYGGVLSVTSQPRFLLQVDLPGGEMGV